MFREIDYAYGPCVKRFTPPFGHPLTLFTPHTTLRESSLDQHSLIAVCSIAFVSVFVLLGFLALAMHAITLAFPERRRGADQAVVSAIATSVAMLYPGARVTRIEEER